MTEAIRFTDGRRPLAYETCSSPGLLLRYEIAFDRQFARALARLIQLQPEPGSRPAVPYHPTFPNRRHLGHKFIV